MVLPNTLMIGVQKSGTTSLFDILDNHPDIYAPFQVKDLPFFTDDTLNQKGLDFYDSIFDKWNNEKIIAGSDVNISYFSHKAIPGIYEMNPDVKLVITLRNPIDRAYSGYKYACQRGLEPKTFKEAIEEEIHGYRKYNTHYQQAQLDYIGHGFYYRQLARVLEYFPRNQLFIGFFEDYKNDKTQFFNELLSFLQVSTDFHFKPIQNTTKGGYRFESLTRLLYAEKNRKSSTINGPFEMLPIPLRMKARRKIFRSLANLNKKNVDFPPLTDEIREKLKNYFEKDIQELSSLLNRDLDKLWL